VTALELLVDLAGICEQRGNDVDAIARVEDALRRHAAARAANPAVPVERALEAAVQYARLQLRMGQADGAREIVRQTLDGIQAARSPTLEVEALTIVAAAAQTSGDIVGAVRECERALVVAGQTGDPMVEARVLLQHGRALIAAGRRELATSGLQRALVAARAGCWDEGVAAVQLLLSSTAR
jgi:tetratricopeptide (TPR) repeat protein